MSIARVEQVIRIGSISLNVKAYYFLQSSFKCTAGRVLKNIYIGLDIDINVMSE